MIALPSQPQPPSTQTPYHTTCGLIGIYTKKNIYIYTRIITMYISAQELAFALSARSDNSSMDGKDGKDGLASSLGVATHHVCGLCGAERTSSYEFHRNMGMALLSCYAVSFNFMQAAITQPQPFNGQDVAPKRKRRVRVRANPRLPRDRPSPASDGLACASVSKKRSPCWRNAGCPRSCLPWNKLWTYTSHPQTRSSASPYV